jgi:glyoxylase-like metal-dependent hydrolase (beta-lactamase superfamily II)
MSVDRVPLDVSIEPLTDWLYCLRTPVVAVYAIRQATGFVLIDSGVVGYEQAYLDALARIDGGRSESVRVTEILLTHGHDDHTGSAAALKEITGATVRGPAPDADVIEGRSPRTEPQLRDWESSLFERFGYVDPAPPVALDGFVNDGDSLGWERPAHVVAAPGHTAGSIAVFLPQDRVLIAGDAVATMSGKPTPGVFNVDREQAQDTFRRLGELDARILCAGHGPAIIVGAQAPLADADAGARAARYAALRWNTPLSEGHADLLIERLAVGPGMSVLDLGCGWGELLARTVASAGSADCTGIGVDTDAGQLDRGRGLIRERGLQRQVTFVNSPAQEWSRPADRIICVGASHAWGGTQEALEALARLVAPGGRLLFGDGCWEAPPTPNAAALFSDVLPLAGITDCAVASGWRTLHLSTASQREWDEFESDWRLGTEEWLQAHPEAAEASRVREELDERLAEYVQIYRGILGFCHLVLGR